jgi:hypothetical protein
MLGVTQLKEHAERAKVLMYKSAVVGAKAAAVLDRYEQTLSTFEANIDSVSREESDLRGLETRVSTMSDETKIVSPTDEEGIAVVKAMDVANEIDWASKDHDKVVMRDALVILAKDYIGFSRACALLELDRPMAPQTTVPTGQSWPADSNQPISAELIDVHSANLDLDAK